MTGTLIATLLLVSNTEQQFFDKEPYINPFVITHFFGGFKHGGMTSTRIVVTEAIDNAWREVEVNNEFIVSRSWDERSSYRVIGKTSNDVYVLTVSGNYGGTLSEVNLMMVSLEEVLTNELDVIKSFDRGSTELQLSELVMTKPMSTEKNSTLWCMPMRRCTETCTETFCWMATSFDSLGSQIKLVKHKSTRWTFPK